MALASVLLYLAVIYIRPGEVIPGWEGFPFAALAAAVSTGMVGLWLLFTRRRFSVQPHDRYVLGFFAAALLSNIVWGWYGGAVDALKILTPTVLCYFLLRASIRSAAHLRTVAYVLVALTLFQAANGIAEFWTGVGLGNVELLAGYADVGYEDPDLAKTPVDANGEERNVRPAAPGESMVMRIRGTGIFHDPNDLAMALVAVVPFLLGPLLRRGARPRTRLLASAALVPILIAIAYTTSRGGMVALALAAAPYGWRLGKGSTALLVIVGLAAVLTLAPERFTQFDTEESSTQGRVHAWDAGLQMLKSRPVLGVGFGQYEEYAERVAHNSFVHSFAELGLIGAFFFAGMIYWLFKGTDRPPIFGRDPESRWFHDWGEDLRNGCLGLCTCAMFLSRQYNVLLYIWLAMSACYRALAQRTPSPPSRERLTDIGMIAAGTVGGVVATYVVVRSLAVWYG